MGNLRIRCYPPRLELDPVAVVHRIDLSVEQQQWVENRIFRIFRFQGVLRKELSPGDKYNPARRMSPGKSTQKAVQSHTSFLLPISGRGEQPQLYFWRTSVGVEVDLVVETAGKLIPVEVKSSATPDRSMAKNIESFRKDLGGSAEKGYLSTRAM